MQCRFVGSSALPGWPGLGKVGISTGNRELNNVNSERFTKNGSGELETQLSQTCQLVLAETLNVVPRTKLEALVLGGGYGRGEGGVLHTESGDRPYNDLEFYVFMHGNRLWNERVYGPRLRQLGERLSPKAGLHVEFKIDSLPHFKRSPVSIFSYDLVSGHKIVLGNETFFEDCQNHLDSTAIPLSEAARLLLNRCSGMLLAQEILNHSAVDDLDLTCEQADFIGRNLAKVQLSLGDGVLVAFGQYHWSCIERVHRLPALIPDEKMPWFAAVQTHHAAGAAFKLQPQKISQPAVHFEKERGELGSLALGVWLWLENRRLGCKFESIRDYSFHPRVKCPGTSAWWNYLLSLRSFGAKAALAPLSLRYPRERLLNALSLLLWNEEVAGEPGIVRHLQRQLVTDAADWAGLVTAYKKLWMHYG
jgi:hypothetical protein